MGNSIGGRRKGAKVMQLDGTAFRVKPPAQVGAARRARPLDHDAPLRPGRLYFLVALPRPTVPPRRAWSGALHVSARERLESLMLTPPTSDLTFLTSAGAGTAPSSPMSSASEGGPVQLRMRLPKAQVAKLMGESGTPPRRPLRSCSSALPAALSRRSVACGSCRRRTGALEGLRRRQSGARGSCRRRTGAGRFAQTPERSPRFAATPGGCQKRTRFVALPDEIIA
ncbi:hypothetical protein ZWY2020_057887 [Hordeum vulgare]|nr:hypothetical protein ZWY2020_057887 [Hordeum vulgare]